MRQPEFPGRGAGAALGAVQAHAATLLFGLAGLFGKWVAAPSLVVAGLRTAIASLCFAALLAAWPRLGAPARPDAPPPPDGPAQPGPPDGSAGHGPTAGRGAGGRRDAERTRQGWRHALLAAFAGAVLGTHWWAFFEAIQVSTVAVALLAYSTAPGFVALLDPLLSRKAPSGGALLAALLVLAGVALLVPRWSLGEATALGAAWGVVAGLLFAILMLLNRRLVPVYGPVRLSFYLNLGASAVLVPLLPGAWVPLSARDWALLALLAVGFTVGAHTLFIGSLQRLKVQTAAIISALEPVYGILGAVILLGEVPGLRTLAGGALILGTVLWVTGRAAWPRRE
jgi:drug/metabolite transporter (DMT)-like permease